MCDTNLHFTYLLTYQRHQTAIQAQAHREPQQGPGKHSHEAPLKHFRGAPLRKILKNFSFQNGAFWCTLYF